MFPSIQSKGVELATPPTNRPGGRILKSLFTRLDRTHSLGSDEASVCLNSFVSLNLK